MPVSAPPPIVTAAQIPVRPLRRLKLTEALRRAGISRASYYRDKSRLPAPIREKGQLYFLEHQLDEHFAMQFAGVEEVA